VRSASDVLVTWPTARGTLRRPASIEVRQIDFRHDMAVLTYYVEPHAVARYKEGTPIKVRWGYLPHDTTEFFGTVLFVRPHLENDKHSMRVICIGSSYPLKDVLPEIHVKQSVENVVSRMASQARLDLIRDPSSDNWRMLVRTVNETGWQYLVRLARRQGHTLFVNQTTMHFYDPVRMLLAHKDSWPILRYHFGQGNDFSGDIISFTPALGDQGVPGTNRRGFRILSVDPVTNQIIGADDTGATIHSLAAATKSPRFTGYLGGHPAHSPGEARAYVQGMRRTNRWVHRAEAHVYGNVRLRQGTGVYITGVSAESDGLWYVCEAIHKMSAEHHPQQFRYFTDLVLLRDSNEINAVKRVPRRAVRNAATATSTPVLSNGRWVSKHQVERVNAA